MNPVVINPEGTTQTVTIHEACLHKCNGNYPGGSKKWAENERPVYYDHEINETLLAFLQEFRRNNQKDTIISRALLMDLYLEKHPEFKRVPTKQLGTQITLMLKAAGVPRLRTRSADHQRYEWPLDVIP